MKKNPDDPGTIAALMMRLQNHRLPRAQRLLDHVNRGETLSDSELQFLHRVFEDSRGLRPLVERNPQYLSLVSKMIDLYSEIVAKALENEKKRADS